MARKRRQIALDERTAQVSLEEKQDLEMERAARRGPSQQGAASELAGQQDAPVQARTTEREVELVLEMPAAAAVSVAGTFNNWDIQHNPLQKGKDGLWRTRVRAPVGRHEYRFIVDGQWMSDPKAAESVANPHGSSNSILNV